jgi:sugar lactone lactonase YvrE
VHTSPQTRVARLRTLAAATCLTLAAACSSGGDTADPADAAAPAGESPAAAAERPALDPEPPTGEAVDNSRDTFPAGVDPIAWDDLPPRPALEGPLGTNDLLAQAELHGEGQLASPEDVAPGLDGHLYTGTEDGGIWRIELDADEEVTGIEQVAQVDGRPLGLDPYDERTIIAAVGRLGLVAIDTVDGEVTMLADRYEGEMIHFADGVVVAEDGTIYFTEASTLYNPGFPYDLIDGRPRGRVFRYEPASSELTLVADELFFPNGIAVTPDEASVIVAETWRLRLTRITVDGDDDGSDEGQAEAFGPSLVSLPDNIRLDDAGRVWVGGSELRNDGIDALLSNVDLRRAFSQQSPEQIAGNRPRYGYAMVLSPEGEPIFSFHDATGRYFQSSAVLPGERYVTFGSVRDTGIARLPMPPELTE